MKRVLNVHHDAGLLINRNKNAYYQRQTERRTERDREGGPAMNRLAVIKICFTCINFNPSYYLLVI